MGRGSLKRGKENARRGQGRKRIVLNVAVGKRRKARAAERGSGSSARGRKARLLIAAGIALLLLACGLLPAVHRVFTPAGFTVNMVKVDQEHLFREREIVTLAGIEKGGSLFSLKLSDIRSRICAHPDVRDARVSRHLPGTVKVAVYERFPIAAVHRGSRYVVDEEGVILSERKERSSRTLPLLVGLELGKVIPGRRLSSPEAARALAVVKQYRESALCRQMELMSVDVRDPDNLVLRTRAIQEIRLGRGDPVERLQLLSYILEQRKRLGRDGPARYIDLRWNNATEMPLSEKGATGKG